MAVITTTRKGDCTLVLITGRLTAADMGRLEHSCSPALILPALRLDIDLRGVTHLDRTATAVLDRLAARGAVVTRGATTYLMEERTWRTGRTRNGFKGS